MQQLLVSAEESQELENFSEYDERGVKILRKRPCHLKLPARGALAVAMTVDAYLILATIRGAGRSSLSRI